MTIKKWLLVLSLILPLPWVAFDAASEPSHVYQYYLEEGIKAFEQQQDEDAARYFRWAHQLDPSAPEPFMYLDLLMARKTPYQPGRFRSRESSPYFDQLLKNGTEAMASQDYEKAEEYFSEAQRMDPEASQPTEYLNLLRRQKEQRVQELDRKKAVALILDRFEKGEVKAVEPVAALPKSSVQNAAVAAKPAEKPKEKLPATFLKKKEPDIITLDEIMNAAQGGRASIKVEMGSSVIIEGKNIERFLIVSEGVVTITRITRDQLKLDAQRWGSTFVHVWDEGTGSMARRTIYVDVVIPSADIGPVRQAAIDHAAPFRLRYSNDWNAYYSGPDIQHLKRQKPSYQQNIGVEGETPYGLLDASAGMVGYHPVTNVTTYTMGLSGIPLEGVDNFKIRLFDSSRSTSPLTLSGTSLRGGFLDVEFFKEMVGLSLTHGQRMGAFGYFSQGGSNASDSYIDAARIVLFPRNPNKRYAFNYAKGSGQDRDPSLTKQVYSLEGRQKLGAVTLKGELAKDDKTTATTSGMEWQQGQAKTALNFRDINKEFTTVTGAGSGQGEIGATWTASVPVGKVDSEASLDVYRDRIDFNEQDPNALNYDAALGMDVPFNEKYTLSSGVHYTHTPGELSPRRYVSGDMRLTRALPVWGGRNASFYVGPLLQRSRYMTSPTSEYDRYGLISGMQVPLLDGLSYTASYEYSWLHELASEADYNPNVFNTGLSYNKQLTERLSGNFGLSYRNEEGLGGTNSFLAGEDSVEGSAGFVYTPLKDVDIFFDSRLRDVWSQVTGNPSYYEFDMRLGMRAAWGSPLVWDPQGTVEGVVFKDANGNGVLDKEEEGIPDIKVKVGEKETVTGVKGWYHMAVKAKRVDVSPITTNLPTGYVFSTPMSKQVNIRQGLRDRVDFGLTTQSGVFGVVFVDKNDNGQPDPGDQFVSRVKLLLDGKLAQVSDSRGAYFFKNVAPGKHALAIDMASLPMNFIPKVKIKNEVSVAEGVTYVFHIPMQQKE